MAILLLLYYYTTILYYFCKICSLQYCTKQRRCVHQLLFAKGLTFRVRADLTLFFEMKERLDVWLIEEIPL